jgi:hypothetical protein
MILKICHPQKNGGLGICRRPLTTDRYMAMRLSLTRWTGTTSACTSKNKGRRTDASPTT